jgi:hypothetical protein
MAIAPAAMVRLFDDHRLGEIARLVDVSSKDERGVVGEQLQGHREDDRCH